MNNNATAMRNRQRRILHTINVANMLPITLLMFMAYITHSLTLPPSNSLKSQYVFHHHQNKISTLQKQPSTCYRRTESCLSRFLLLGLTVSSSGQQCSTRRNASTSTTDFNQNCISVSNNVEASNKNNCPQSIKSSFQVRLTSSTISTNDRNIIEENNIKNKMEKDSSELNPESHMLRGEGPRHIAFICDGNSRWARQQQRTRNPNTSVNNDKNVKLRENVYNLPTSTGHAKGASRIISTLQHLKRHHPNVSHVTMYGFSTENWNRPKEEISDIWKVMEYTSKTFYKWALKEDIIVKILGDLDDARIPESLRYSLRTLEQDTAKEAAVKRRRMAEKNEDAIGHSKESKESNFHQQKTLCLAVNYGGRRDIMNASLKIAEMMIESRGISGNDNSDSRGEEADLNSDQKMVLNEDTFGNLLCTSGIPDVDLVIRTGGERRLSNFLLWNCAYSELYFSDILWPDFDEKEVDGALDWFCCRNRRFGGRSDDEIHKDRNWSNAKVK